MALTFLGVTSFSQCGPEQWRLGQFELDQMSVPFSGAVTGLTTYISSLTRGSAWSGDSSMFLTGWSVSDSNKQYPTVTLEYMGAKAGLLPPAKIDYDDQVQTASSSRSASTVLSSPLTVEYYAPSVIYSWITANSRGSSSGGVTPDSDPRIIKITTGDTSFSSSGTVAEIVAAYFSIEIITSFKATELVRDSKYYLNEIRSTKFYAPLIFDFPSGGHFTLYNPGNGYSVGDILTVSGDSGSGTVKVLSVGSVWGGGTGILSFEQLSNSFTQNESALPASGGSGSGAGFNVFVVP